MGLSSLSTLGLFHNQLMDLEALLSVCKHLPKLRQLDVASNPCTQHAAATHEIVRRLPRLRQLDGEALSALDRDLSEMFFAKQAKKAQAAASASDRPATAPSGE